MLCFPGLSLFDEVLVHCILLGPRPCRFLVTASLVLVNVSNLRDKRVIGVGVREEGGDREKDLRDGQSRAPLLLEDVKADAAIGVYVRVVYL